MHTRLRADAVGEWRIGVGGATERSESADRTTLRLPGRRDDLVAAVNPRTLVVVNSGAPVEMPWTAEIG